jgi:hypothetical protein
MNSIAGLKGRHQLTQDFSPALIVIEKKLSPEGVQ